ncbi:pyridoxamine 5'-phosphate oxidase-domain-containing protein [Limtongia smithiae]|uniref:pyridoxamine 5'-phosphate oxidase-domain-containing protein n=1 Tax=Limtongia smithiae TaxID=1125753 RepID=UPI0034D02205
MAHNHAPHGLSHVVPPWVASFKSHLPASGVSPFTLATISTTTPPRPLARTCMFRGFAFTPNSGILVVTTDRRMPKYAQLASATHAGVFEACFYFAEKAVQYRLSGAAKLVARSPASGGLVLVDPARGGIEEPAAPEFVREYDAAWAALSPQMQLSFLKPPPGAALTQDSADALDEVARLTQEAAAAGREAVLSPEHATAAQENFVLMLLIPSLVDFVDLEGVGTRIAFTQASQYEWSFSEVCP